MADHYDNDIQNNNDFREETAAEFADPVSPQREGRREENNYDRNDVKERNNAGVWGFCALAVSIISLFIMPVFLGIVGVILGFVARRRNASALGSWAIGIGVVAIILGIFVMPFF
ncbi:DUF4190 domain-containing protein [Bacillaceae bacterium Marseille-Q3522]|nr:DUF4190 domain-containing protein [Bacillaceae bacterium Marseille-Q3522]